MKITPTLALLTLLLLPLIAMAQPVSTVGEFSELIASYATAEEDIVVEVSANLTLTSLVSIPTPGTAGITLTMRSANPAAPVILTRGISGDLFTVSAEATFILEDIIIDGDKDGDFADAGGALAKVDANGTFFIEEGSVLRNNDNNGRYGGGVYVYGSGALVMNDGEISGNNAQNGGGIASRSKSGTFTMNGGAIANNTANDIHYGGGVYAEGAFTMNSGEISENTTNGAGGGISVPGGIFILNDGEIKNNTAGYGGGGVIISHSGAFTMNGGKISGNTASGSAIATSGIGGGVLIYGLYGNNTFTMSGGEISGNTASRDGDEVCLSDKGALFVIIGGDVSENMNVIGLGVIIRWSKPATGPFVYTEGSSDGLNIKPAEATAFWAIEDGKFGVSYENGDNEGFIEMPEATVMEDPAPIRRPQIASSQISVKAASGAILLENLPANSKVQIYNLRGELVYSQFSILHSQLIEVQAKGVYIVKINSTSHRIAVR